MNREVEFCNTNKCRICTKCACATENNDLFQKSNLNLLQQLQTLTGVMLENDKQLPRHICLECRVDLSRACEFRERFLAAQNFFLSAYKENEALNDMPKEKSDNSNNSQSSRSDSSGDDDSDVEFVPQSNKSILKPTKQSVNKHRKITNKQQLICDQCGNCFHTRQNLESHLRRHFNEKPYECEICPEKFFTSPDLKRHMRLHTGEKPFACRTCDRRFVDSSSRSRHERSSHKNLRPYSCKICGKAFTNSYILKNHMLTHTKERAFECELCNKTFLRRTHLVTHYRSTFHKENSEKFTQNSIKKFNNV